MYSPCCGRHKSCVLVRRADDLPDRGGQSRTNGQTNRTILRAFQTGGRLAKPRSAKWDRRTDRRTNNQQIDSHTNNQSALDTDAQHTPRPNSIVYTFVQTNRLTNIFCSCAYVCVRTGSSPFHSVTILGLACLDSFFSALCRPCHLPRTWSGICLMAAVTHFAAQIQRPPQRCAVLQVDRGMLSVHEIAITGSGYITNPP